MEVWLWSYFGAQGQKPDGLGFRLWGFRVFCNFAICRVLFGFWILGALHGFQALQGLTW